eukprot:m51a1_g3553 hypothetical protein (430) ;mRNA; r:1024607-1027905
MSKVFGNNNLAAVSVAACLSSGPSSPSTSSRKRSGSGRGSGALAFESTAAAALEHASSAAAMVLLVAGLAGLVAGFEGAACNALVLSAGCSSGPALAALARGAMEGGRARALCCAAGIASIALLNAAVAFVLALFDGVGCALLVHAAGVLAGCAAMALSGSSALSVFPRRTAKSAGAPRRRARDPTECACERESECEQGVKRGVTATVVGVDAESQTDDVPEETQQQQHDSDNTAQYSPSSTRTLPSANRSVDDDNNNSDDDEDAICELAGQIELAAVLQARVAQGDAAVAQLCADRQAALAAIAQLQTHLVAATAAARRDAGTAAHGSSGSSSRANRAVVRGLGLVVVAETLTLAGAGSPSAPSPALCLACARSAEETHSLIPAFVSTRLWENNMPIYLLIQLCCHRSWCYLLASHHTVAIHLQPFLL